MSYSFHIGMAVSVRCGACRSEETLQHILCDCPGNNNKRQSLASALAHLDNGPMSSEAILKMSSREDIAAEGDEGTT